MEQYNVELLVSYMQLAQRLTDLRRENDLLRDQLDTLQQDYEWLGECYDSLMAQHYESRYL